MAIGHLKQPVVLKGHTEQQLWFCCGLPTVYGDLLLEIWPENPSRSMCKHFGFSWLQMIAGSKKCSSDPLFDVAESWVVVEVLSESLWNVGRQSIAAMSISMKRS